MSPTPDIQEQLRAALGMVMPSLGQGQGQGGAPQEEPQGQAPTVPQQAPQAPNPQVLDQQTIAELAKRGLQTKQDAFDRLREHFYGVGEGEEPTTGRKIKRRLPEVLKALFQGNYEAPEDTWRNRLNKNFPDETQRMQGVLGPLERMQTSQQTLQSQMAMKQQQLDALNERARLDREAKAEKEKHADVGRQALAEYRSNRAKSLGNLDAQRANEATAHTAILQYKAQHPDITPGQLFDDLSKGMTNPMDKAELWNFINHPGAGIGTSTTSQAHTNDETKVTTTESTRSKNLTAPRSAVSDAFSRMGVTPFDQATPSPTQSPLTQGALSVPPAVPSKPIVRSTVQVPQTTAPTTTRPAAHKPGAVILPDGSYSNDPNEQNDWRNPFVNPNEPGKPLVAAREDAAKKDQIAAKKTEAFETQAGGGLDNIIRASLNGSADKFQGLAEGNPIAITLRSLLGTKTIEETRAALGNIDMLYNKLGINVRGRFTVPEISGHLQTMGNLTSTPQNAIMAIAALKMQAELSRMESLGKMRGLKPEDVSYLVSNEMKRLAGAVDDAKKTNSTGRRAIVAGGPTSPELRLRSVEDIIKQAKTEKALGGLTPEQKAAAIREELKRRGVK